MRAAAALLLTLIVAACGGSPAGVLFQTTVANADGTYPMPVTLGDTTGLVTSIEAVVLRDWPGDGPTVQVDPTNPNALVLSWMGGACEDETVVGFWPVEGKFGMYVAPRGGVSFFGGCPAIGVLRAVRIHLSAPVDPALISFTSAA